MARRRTKSRRLVAAYRRGFASIHAPENLDDAQKKPAKAGAGFDSKFFEFQGGSAAPWSSVNNSTGDQKISNLRELSTELPAEKLRDPTSLTRQERRAALRVMRSSCRDEKKSQIYQQRRRSHLQLQMI